MIPTAVTPVAASAVATVMTNPVAPVAVANPVATPASTAGNVVTTAPANNDNNTTMMGMANAVPMANAALHQAVPPTPSLATATMDPLAVVTQLLPQHQPQRPSSLLDALTVAAVDDDDDDAATADPQVQAKKRKDRLEQNRISARESRKRKKGMIEELQRTVITLSRENKDLNVSNEGIRRRLMEIGTKHPGSVPLHALMAFNQVVLPAATAAPMPMMPPQAGNMTNHSGVTAPGAPTAVAAAPIPMTTTMMPGLTYQVVPAPPQATPPLHNNVGRK